VRILCVKCKEPYEPVKDELVRIGISAGEVAESGSCLYRARGCSECLGTGYAGRSGIFEILVINDDIRNLTLGSVDSTTIKRKANEHGMTTLRVDGAEKVLKGQTSIDEVMRVAEESDDHL
jgi:type II secretory ATPase GspE/PulE/Tfp pilus assembly ATPase PilB-like protein